MSRRLVGMIALASGLATASLAATSQPAQRSDPTGTWKSEWTRGDRTFTSVLELRVGRGKVTGTYKGMRGEPTKIQKAKLEGDKISFECIREFNDNSFTIKYQGKVTDDRIKGTIEFNAGGEARTRDWEVRRVVGPPDVVGEWRFTVKTEDGNTLEPRIVITRDGDKLKGVYTSRDRERPVKKIEIKDGQLKFVVAGERDDNKFSVAYTGKPRGNAIKGTIDYDFNGNAGTIDFTGKRKLAVDPAGTWTWERTRGERTYTSTLKFEVKDGKLTGTYKGGRGEPVKIESPKLDGDKISFQVTRAFRDRKFTTKYQGKVSGDRITGTRTFTRDGETQSREWEAKRGPAGEKPRPATPA